MSDHQVRMINPSPSSPIFPPPAQVRLPGLGWLTPPLLSFPRVPLPWFTRFHRNVDFLCRILICLFFLLSFFEYYIFVSLHIHTITTQNTKNNYTLMIKKSVWFYNLGKRFFVILWDNIFLFCLIFFSFCLFFAFKKNLCFVHIPFLFSSAKFF